MIYQNNPASIDNPLQDAIGDGYSIRQHLAAKAEEMSEAQARRHQAQRAHTDAKRAYDDAEAEWLAEFTITDGRYASAKNAEGREIVKDAALVQARNRGALAQSWAALLRTERDSGTADNAYLQVEIEFKAVRTAAELTAQALRAAAI